MRLRQSSNGGISWKRDLRRTGLLLASIVVAACAFASSANAFVYWASYAGSHGTEIYRANLDGSVNRPFVTNARTPCGVAVDAQHIYWANLLGNSIGRANLDGTGVNQTFIPLPSTNGPCGVAVNGSQIWWVQHKQGDPNGATIGRANLDGTGVNQSMFGLPQVHSPCGVAVDSSYVYWVNNFGSSPNIWRAGLDGTPPPAQIVSNAAPALGTACWPTVSGSRLYWWASPWGIVSADLDGNNPRVVVGAAAGGGIAIHGGQVYWLNPAGDGTISRANLDGSSAGLAFASAPNSRGLAVDSGVPSNHFSFGKLKRNRSKGTARLGVKVPDPGKLMVTGKGVVKHRPGDAQASKRVSVRGTVYLFVKAKGKRKRRLNRRGIVTLRLRVNYSPTGGTPSAKRKQVKLIKR